MPLRREDSSGTLHELGTLYREDGSANLINLGTIYRELSDGSLVLVFQAAHAPQNLSTQWNYNADAYDLSWDPDDNNPQTVYRCQGSNCDPQTDGSSIATLSAGVSSYQDTFPDCDGGRTFGYQVGSSLGDSNIEHAGEPACLQ